MGKLAVTDLNITGILTIMEFWVLTKNLPKRTQSAITEIFAIMAYS